MRLKLPILRTVVAFVLLFGTVAARDPDRATPPRDPATIEVKSLDGRFIRPFAAAKTTLHVLIFLSNDCPICNRYAPEIRRLSEAYRPRGVSLWLVHPLADETETSIREHAREYQLPGEILLDPARILTRFAGVRVTPESVVLNAKAEILYRGRIDDWFPELGRQRAEPTRRDLREAIEAGLDGRPITVPRTKAVGCSIPDLN